jgi:hypothetical protein
MIVVSNTSPIINLACVGQLQLLGQIYGAITSTLSEYLSLFIMFLLTTGRIDRGLPFTVADFHLTDDLLYGGIPPR